MLLFRLLVFLLFPYFLEAAQNLNLLTIGGLTSYGVFPTPKTHDFNLALQINFLLAVKHVNERRDDILPVLGSPLMKACTRNLSIVLVDDGQNVAKHMYNMDHFLNKIHGIVGMDSSTRATHASLLANVKHLPVVSHWVSSPVFSDKKTYPNFVRTGASDGQVASRVVALLNQFGVKRFSFLYLDSQLETKQVYEKECNRFGIALASFAMPRDDDNGIRQAVYAAAALRNNFLVVHTNFRGILEVLPSLFNETGFLQNDKTIIFTDFTRFGTTADLQKDANLNNMYRGSFRVFSGARSTILFDAYLTKWTTEFANEETRAYLNAHLFPRGNQNNTDLNSYDISDWAYSVNVSASDFFVNSRASAFSTWAHAYDSVVSLAVAACELGDTDPVSPADLLARVKQVEFEGLSGLVKFDDHGDRDPNTFVYTLQNWNAPVANVSTVSEIGTFNETLQQFVLSKSETFRLGGSMPPPDISPPVHNFQYLPDALKILAYFSLSVLCLVVLYCVVWVCINRTNRVVVASQGDFLLFFAFGCFVSAWAILPLTIDDNPDSMTAMLDPSQACMAAPFLFSLGFNMSLGALLVKSYRVLSVLNSHKLTRLQGVRKNTTWLLLLLYITLDLVLLFAWTFSFPLTFQRSVELSDINGFPLLSFGACGLNPVNPTGSMAFLWILILMHVVAMVALGVIGGLVRRNIPEDFFEVKQVNLMLTAVGQLYVLTVLVFFAIFRNPIGHSPATGISLWAQNGSSNMLYRVWKEQHSSGAEIDFEEGVKNAHIFEKFRRFAELNYVVEMVYFYQDVQAFKHGVANNQQSWKEAQDLADMYIQAGGLLQINISDGMRTNILNAIKQKSPNQPGEVFDVAIKEIAGLLNNGAWRTFVEEGGMYVHNKTITSKDQFPSTGAPGTGTLSSFVARPSNLL